MVRSLCQGTKILPSLKRVHSISDSEFWSTARDAVEDLELTMSVYTIYYGLCTINSILLLYTIYYILYTIYYILYTIYYILYTIYYILYTIYYILYTIYYILYTIYYILYTIYYILYTIYYILYTIYYILYTIYYILYIIIYFILYTTKMRLSCFVSRGDQVSKRRALTCAEVKKQLRRCLFELGLMSPI